MALFRRRTRITCVRADVAATNGVDAIVREALCRRRTGSAVVIAADAIAPAFPTDAAIAIGIGFRSDVAARSVWTAAFFGGAAR